MKSILAIIALASLALAGSIAAQEGDQVIWLSDLALATELAQDSGLPILVVFR
jgi:hypothetical protein